MRTNPYFKTSSPIVVPLPNKAVVRVNLNLVTAGSTILGFRLRLILLLLDKLFRPYLYFLPNDSTWI